VARRIAWALLASALVAGCGGHGSKAQSAASTTRPSNPVVMSGPGKLVPIGGGRSLYLECVGSGSPTVVLEAGFGADARNWAGVQPQIGRMTRTCSYDRAGLGNSVARPGVHDARDELSDLGRLLAGAHIAPPYVVVGHSYGGLLARLFARAHPDATAGVVLVDSMTRAQTRRQLAIWPRSEYRAVRRQVATPVRDGVDLGAGEALAARITSLGDTPLAVVTAGTHRDEWGRAPRRLARALDRQWATMQDELARLSPDHVHVVALRSDHVVMGPDGDPPVVVRAVDAVVRAARDHARLPACRSVFSGPDVRCSG
jgi:pimeloyl-ACP methyl ester carboxylesterase